jgi:hypothetical protein
MLPKKKKCKDNTSIDFFTFPYGVASIYSITYSEECCELIPYLDRRTMTAVDEECLKSDDVVTMT